MSDLVVSNVRPWAQAATDELVDVLVLRGRIAAVGPGAAREAPSPPGQLETVDGAGGVLLPAFVDAHAHLDSTLLGLPFRTHTAAPGLAGLIANDRENWRDAGAKDATLRANEVWKRALAAYQPPPLDPAVSEALDAFMARRRRELGE